MALKQLEDAYDQREALFSREVERREPDANRNPWSGKSMSYADQSDRNSSGLGGRGRGLGLPAVSAKKTYTFSEKDVKALIAAYIREVEGVSVDASKVVATIRPGYSDPRGDSSPASATFSVEIPL